MTGSNSAARRPMMNGSPAHVEEAADLIPREAGCIVSCTNQLACCPRDSIVLLPLTANDGLLHLTAASNKARGLVNEWCKLQVNLTYLRRGRPQRKSEYQATRRDELASRQVPDHGGQPPADGLCFNAQR